MRSTFFQSDRLRSWWGSLGRRKGTSETALVEGRPAGRAFPPTAETIAPTADHLGPETLEAYLSANQNFPEDIPKSRSILSLRQLVVEIGCGTADIARQVALRNPDIGVLATDKFDCSGPGSCGSGYRRVALAWREKKLDAQQSCPENLVVLRAEIDLLHYMPPHSIDAVMLINPEPAVGQAVLASLATPTIYSKLKPDTGQIVVLPFSREMGVMTYGGLEFEHSPDWSRGLGFLKSSPLAFRRTQRLQWGIDIAASRYTTNSTQSDAYVHTVAP